MKKYIFIYIAFFIFGGIPLASAQDDTMSSDKVMMKDGTVIKGDILDASDQEIRIKNENGEIQYILLVNIIKYYQNLDDDSTFVWINENPQLPENSTYIETERYQRSSFIKTREIGINMSGLLSQFVPFGRSTTATGPYNFTLRIGKGKDLFHFQLGLDAEEGSFGDLNHFNLAIGYMRKTDLSDKFKYYKFFDLMAFSGSFNDPTSPSTNDFFSDDGGAGVGIGFGIEYELYKNLYVGTETILYIGSPSIDFIPPAAIYLIAKLDR